MNRCLCLLRSLTVIAAAVALVAACGGGDGSPPPAVSSESQLVNDDSADPASLAAITTILESVDAKIAALDIPGASNDAPGQARLGGIGFGWFPGVKQTNLIANKPEFGAQILDPEMQNAWGIAIRPAGFGGHFWVSSTNVGKSLLYVGDVGGTPLFQDDLKFVNTLGAPTGVVFNEGAQFVITQQHENGPITNAAKFLFANASGTITAWTERARAAGGFDRPVDSAVVVDGTARGSEFLGVALSPAGDRMLAADFGAEAALRVYDGKFAEVGAFANPFNPNKKPDGFEAFNVQTLGDSVFAMYARHVPPGAELPEGRLAEFDASGQLIAKWRGRGYLNNPWGVAKAPKDFGLYSGCLLVGNFGDGTVVAFHPRFKVALDYVRDAHGKRVVIDGLWGLQFGNGASLGEANHVYFAAGPNKEVDGLFGKLEPNPKTLPYIGGISLCQ